MLILRQIDPVGVRERARHRIIRRVYTGKVSFNLIVAQMLSYSYAWFLYV